MTEGSEVKLACHGGSTRRDTGARSAGWEAA